MTPPPDMPHTTPSAHPYPPGTPVTITNGPRIGTHATIESFRIPHTTPNYTLRMTVGGTLHSDYLPQDITPTAPTAPTTDDTPTPRWYIPPPIRTTSDRRFEPLRVQFDTPTDPHAPLRNTWDDATVIYDHHTNRFSGPTTTDPNVAWTVANLYEQEPQHGRWYDDTDIPEPHTLQPIPPTTESDQT